MDAKTKKILIGVCVAGFILTSTFTWGVISAGIDVAQKGAELAIDFGQGGVEKTRVLSQWSIAWILAHANLMVPVFFMAAVIWLARQKPKE